MIYIVAIFFSLVGLYAISNLFLYSLPIVEAGPIAGIKHTGIQRMSERINASYKKTINGVTYKYRRFVVQGTCMQKIGIFPKSTVAARILNGEKKELALKAGDAVLIFLNDNNFRGYKIRIIKRLVDDKAETFYYNEDGSEHPSSQKHTIASIIGIVDLRESGIAV